MKILIVSVFFPPQNSIASLRPYSWAKWWSSAGHEITVLTTTKKANDNDLMMDISKFFVVEIPVPFFTNNPDPPNTLSAKNKKKNCFKILSYFKKKIIYISKKTGCFLVCRFPDFHELWVKKALQSIGSSHFDMIISTGWPYPVHRIGLALKQKQPGIRWVVDWRDLWTKNHLFNGFVLFHAYERYLENKFHKTADLITTISDPLSDILKSMTNTRVETIYNGFDPEDFSQIMQTERKINAVFTIVYTGSIYKKFRDPIPLFKAASNLKRHGLIDGKKLQILFAGPNDVIDLAEEYQITDMYSFLGFIPREEALQLQYDADAVLFLEYTDPNVPGILTGKLFEYLYAAREILAVGIEGTTTAGDLINRVHAGVCLGTDIQKIEEYLIARIVNNKKLPYTKDIEIISSFERKKQAMKLLKYVSYI